MIFSNSLEIKYNKSCSPNGEGSKERNCYPPLFNGDQETKENKMINLIALLILVLFITLVAKQSEVNRERLNTDKWRSMAIMLNNERYNQDAIKKLWSK